MELMDVLGFLSGLILGASVIVIMSIPLFVKRAVETYAEKAVGSVFEKKIEKYKAELSRAAMAREVMLKREMAFYDMIDKQIAILVPLIQDVRDDLTEWPFTEEKRNRFARIPELSIEMKDVSLRYEAYVPTDIWAAFNKLVVELQLQCGQWLDFAKKISSENEIDAEGKDVAERMCDTVLSLVETVRVRQADYLRSISGGEK